MFRRLWWRFQLWRYILKARRAKAHWIACRETIKPCQRVQEAEVKYCDMVVAVKTYRLMLSPLHAGPPAKATTADIPVAKVVRRGR